jgi:type I restriction enzyme S subunit
MLEGWQRKTVEEICERVSVGIVIQPAQYYVPNGDGVKTFRSANVGENRVVDTDWVYLSREGHEANLKSELRAGDVLVVRSGAPGTACVVPPEYDGCNCIDIVFARPDQSKVLPHFLAEYTNSPEGRRHVLGNQGGLALKHFNVGAYKQLEILLPPLAEQRKIIEILRTWDEAIDACERRGLALRKQFEGLRLRLFEAAYSSDNRTRHAKDLFEAVSEKKQTHLPLLAVMQDIGVVRRDELDRRVVMPDGDVDGYKVVREGDFVISLRSFEGGLEYSRVTGLVSPAYTVLRSVGGEYVGDYYRQFFKSKSFIGRLDKLIFGIRDGKQIAFRDFGDMKIPNPPRDEQEAAAEVLGMAEHQIRLAEQEALALQRQKRGLMQKLLTGEWRVKVDA